MLVRNLRFPFPTADLSTAPETIRDAVRAARSLDPSVLQATIEQALVDRFGLWTTGWMWSASGGGLVKAYCCPPHSLKGTDEEIVSAVLRALDDWRATIAELTTLFAEIHTNTRALPLERAAEHAAAAVLPWVLARNRADEAWYGTFTDVLTWCLEASGLDRDVFARPMKDVVSGHFRSWVEPDAETVKAAAEALGVAVAIEEPREHDALAEWRSVRDKAFASMPQPWKIPLVWDGHARFVERSGDERMRRALAECRASARRNEPLDLARLTQWQRLVLDDAVVGFRTTDAFAKNGRERYGFDEQTKGRFARWLADANDPAIPAAVRAARVYLDICFTHPFPDGNARAARLALDHVLTREGLVLRAIEPICQLWRAPDDFRGAWTLVWLVGYLAGSIDTIASPT